MEKGKSGRITESEWQLMEFLWKHKYGITQPELMLELGERWNKNTVHTFLTRLTEKGFVIVEKSESPHRYAAKVSREECVKEERDSFLERIYGGSVSRMVASFVTEGNINKKDAEELKHLLEELEE